MREELQA
ncbi:hypothetical protein LINPERPRIM_LOCUS30870 [Linum perenne]